MVKHRPRQRDVICTIEGEIRRFIPKKRSLPTDQSTMLASSTNRNGLLSTSPDAGDAHSNDNRASMQRKRIAHVQRRKLDRNNKYRRPSRGRHLVRRSKLERTNNSRNKHTIQRNGNRDFMQSTSFTSRLIHHGRIRLLDRANGSAKRDRMRPCTCGKCHLCWLAENDPRYQELWEVKKPCKHRGDVIELERCGSCYKKVYHKIYWCELHLACTLSKDAKTARRCSECSDYKPQ